VINISLVDGGRSFHLMANGLPLSENFINYWQTHQKRSDRCW